MTHDFLNDLQVGFVLAEASAECVPQDMAAKLWQKNRVTIFFLRLGFFFLIIVCTNRADSAVDGIGEINLSIASAENKAGVYWRRCPEIISYPSPSGRGLAISGASTPN